MASSQQNIAAFRRALQEAPGPSPWYLLKSRDRLRTSSGPLRWQPAPDKGPLAGKTLLKDRSGAALLVLGYYCCVQPMAGGRLLIWTVEESLQKRKARAAIVFRVVDLERLIPIEESDAASSMMSPSGARVFPLDPVDTTFRIPTDLSAGNHKIVVPDDLRNLVELLVLAHSESAPLVLFDFRPKAGIVEVLPQDWFNNGSYDFGYQWVTRVAREKETGKIVGEGIRLGEFVLDHSNRNVDYWIQQDDFFHPER